MSEITAELVKELRERTGISIMQCRKALEEAGGDLQKAIEVLQSKSGDVASKKGDRTLGAGTIASYIHSTGNVGTLVELLCETDFVAKNEEFVRLAKDIAMHSAATKPQYIKSDDIPEDRKSQEGIGESVLLDQAFIKDPEVTIKGLIERATQKFGERMELSRIAIFSVTQ
ncbi:MAG: elongation factor Ts [Minisyncoccia bacterium]